jgi:ssDNA-binding Zn-finger/Zn-ribbon topoisomerase 1
MEKIGPITLERNCPNCNQPLVERRGRYGTFVGCSSYPECRFIEKKKQELNQENFLSQPCPSCQQGKLIIRYNK